VETFGPEPFKRMWAKFNWEELQFNPRPFQTEATRPPYQEQREELRIGPKRSTKLTFRRNQIGLGKFYQKPWPKVF